MVAVATIGSGPVMDVVTYVKQPPASETLTVYSPTERPAISSSTAPLLHTKLYGLVPPLTVKLITPVAPSEHAFEMACVVTVGPVVLLTATVVDTTQPTSSVITQVYMPAQRFVAVAVVCPAGSSHRYELPLPLVDAVADPSGLMHVA